MFQSLLNKPTAYAALTGVLLTLAFPKIDAGWIAWAALIPLLLAVEGARPADAFRLGWIAGVIHYLGLLYWLVHTMQTYGRLPVYLSIPLLFLLAAYLALYTGIFTTVLSVMGRPGVFWAVGGPMAWVFLEYVRGHLFSGFPWELLGHSQYRVLPLIQISDLVGGYGVSFLIVAVNMALFLLVLDRRGGKERISRRRVWIICGITAAMLIAVITYGTLRMALIDQRAAEAKPLTVTVVQGNIDQVLKWNPAFQADTTEKYIRMTLSAQPKQPDLVVWPETAVPFYLFHDRPLTRTVIDAVKRMDAHFIIGSPAFERNNGEIRYYNSAYLIDPEGRPLGRFDKVHLVPFGEYVPMQRWLPFVQKIVAQIGDFSTGRAGETLSFNGLKTGVLICYEVIFPYLSRAAANNGAGLLVNLTNDAWYGTSSAPYQHLSMAVFRAVEQRRALVRSANTGISGFIDPGGRIMNPTPLFQDKVVTKTVPILTIETPYGRIGDVFPWCCLVGAVFTITMARRRSHVL